MADIVFDKSEFARQLARRFEIGDSADQPVINELRAAATADLEAIDYPDRKQEGWRYTPISGLLGHAFRFSPSVDALQIEDLDDFRIAGLDCWQAVLANGRFAAELSDLAGLPDGVRLLGLRAAAADAGDQELLRAGAATDNDLFAAMNLAGLDDGLLLDVAPGVDLERPLQLLHVSIGLDEPTIAQPRLVVRMGAASRASLIERYVAHGPALYFNNLVIDVETGEESSLRHVRLQTESDQAYQIARQTLRQRRDSRYVLRSLVVGGAWSRYTLDCRLVGEGANADLKGAYLVNGSRFADQHLKVSHEVPHCQSVEDFRGILNGSGRAVFDGNILVERDAQKTDAHLSNNNLLLSRNAEVDTKPQLEIYADDVKCSHGTTVGELDHDAVFYLRSRGIGLEQAKRMLSRGFAQDLFDDVEPEPLASYIARLIDERLIELGDQ